MVYSKTELFDQQLQETADIFKALSHPARLQIILFLSKTTSCFSGDITEVIPLGRTTVSQHLKELKRIGIIQGQIQGAKTNYCLNPDKANEVKSIILTFLEGLNDISTNKCQ